MNCKKSWELMMKHYDNKSTKTREQDALKIHLEKCNECKERFELLNDAFSVMNSLTDKAPAGTEKAVMARLDNAKQEKDLFIPYVILNLIAFVSIILFWLERVFQDGILYYINELIKKMWFAYNASTAVWETYHSFWETIIIRPVLIVLVVAGSIIGILGIISAFKRTNKKQYSEV